MTEPGINEVVGAAGTDAEARGWMNLVAPLDPGPGGTP